MPDVFVPVDTAMNSAYYRDMMAKGVFNTFVIKFIDENRKQLLAKYPKEEDFHRNFVVDDTIIADIVKAAEDEGIKPNEEQLATSLPVVKGVIKGLLARDLYENGVYMRAVNHLDPIFNEALKIVNDPKRYDELLGRIK